MITVKGFKELSSFMNKKANEMSDKPARVRALRKALRVIQIRASELAPKRTGTLSKNIVIERIKSQELSSDDVVMAVGPSKKKAWYGHIVEFGHGKQKPQPFLRPAVEEKEQEAVNILGEELRKVLER